MSFVTVSFRRTSMFVRCLIILFIVLCSAHSQNRPCPKVLTVNITDGDRLGSTIIKDGIHFNAENYFIESNTIYGCVCNVKPCMRKCCDKNEIMVGRSCRKADHNLTLQIHDGDVPTNFKANHYFLHNNTACPYQKRLLRPHMDDQDMFYVQKNGSLFIPSENEPLRGPEGYCIETFHFENLGMNYMTSIILCYREEIEEDTPPETLTSGMIISMPFLLATFIAYALLPDRNLHMKALMFYVINLFFGYLLLVIVQLSNTQIHDIACLLIGYFALFFFIVSFFWMNVICIDIWFAFSGLRGFSGSKKLAERKRFFIYCGYAWGVPVIHTLVVFGIQHITETNSQYNPSIGVGQCFFKRGYPELLYFYGPMAILITINIIFFAITAIKIRKVKKDTSVLKKEDSKRHSYENDKQTFNLYLKLLFAMGINWSMEIISWAVTWADAAPGYVWYLTDFCNAIYGVFIFFIFAFKKNIWKLLKKRYYSFIGRPHLAHSMASTNATRTTSYSTANSLHEHPQGVGANDTTTLTSEASGL